MLPNSPQVKEVMLGDEGMASYMKKGSCFIDMSSINPVDTTYIGGILKEKGIDMLDAPVSGAFMLAKKAGVDPENVFEAIKGGLAGSTVMNAKVPMMIEDNVKPGFRIDLHIKDLNNALECAHSVGAPVPMTAQVSEIMQYLHNNGDGNSDHSAIIHYYEKLTGTKL